MCKRKQKSGSRNNPSKFTLDGISFDKLSAILQYTFAYIINSLSSLQSNINMGRRHFIHMKPAKKIVIELKKMSFLYAIQFD